MRDDLIVSSSGELSPAKVDLQATDKQRQEQRSDIQFVDIRNFTTTVERTVTSKVQQVFSQTQGFARTDGHEQVWTVGGKFGGVVLSGASSMSR